MNARDMPEIYRIFTEMDALHEGLRDRAEDLNISRLELDALANLTPGYSSKLLCDPPMKFIGPQTLPKILKGTGLALALVIDDGRARQIAAKASKRKYRIGRIRTTAPSMPAENQNTPENIEELMKMALQARMREIGLKGNKSAKRRAKEQRRRARQRIASHAARIRWEKTKSGG